MTPALYFGFDKPLPAGLVSLYMDVIEVEGRLDGPSLVWEYWDGTGWRNLSVDDETAGFALAGMVEVLWPGVQSPLASPVLNATGTAIQLVDARDAHRFAAGDRLYITKDGEGEMFDVLQIAGQTITSKTPLTADYNGASVAIASLPRFGVPRTWFRARLQVDGEPLASEINGIYLNSTWAAQIETIEDEVLGSSTEQPNQSFRSRKAPILPGERLQVLERTGRRAEIELPILLDEIQARGMDADDIETERDPVTGEINAAWVTWEFRPHLLFSGPDDRHYTVERSQGRLIFGDGLTGMIPSPGDSNIRLASYRAGGGSQGNVPADSISQILGVVPFAQAVTNPRAAEGGASGESVDAIKWRGPAAVRHRNQALTLADYEDLARQASPAVAVARALPTTRGELRAVTGWVTMIIIPQSQDPQPQPSFELRRVVRKFIAARTPASMGQRLIVTGPTYLPVGVEAAVVPANSSAGGDVFEQVVATLQAFLHPLTGGPDGRGWPFGRDVFLSDIAAKLEAVADVDYVQTLNLLLDGTPRGEQIDVPPERIVVAGTLKVSVLGGER